MRPGEKLDFRGVNKVAKKVIRQMGKGGHDLREEGMVRAMKST